MSRLRGLYRSMLVAIGDLYPLALPGVENASDHLRTMYDWYMVRGMTVVRIALASAGALILALVTALLRNHNGPTVAEVVALAGSATALGTVGLYRLSRVAKMHREFAAAQGLLARFRRLFELIE